MFVSGLVTYLLAHGIDPVKVTGYASLAFMPIFLKLEDVITVEKFLDIDTGIWAIDITAVMALIADGTLQARGDCVDLC